MMDTTLHQSYPITRLQESAENPRRVTTRALDDLRSALRSYGHIGTIVARHMGDDQPPRIISGHQRVQAMIAEGMLQADVTMVTCTDTQERELRLRLNGHAGQWDADMLEHELVALLGDGRDIEGLQIDHSLVGQLAAAQREAEAELAAIERNTTLAPWDDTDTDAHNDLPAPPPADDSATVPAQPAPVLHQITITKAVRILVAAPSPGDALTWAAKNEHAIAELSAPAAHHDTIDHACRSLRTIDDIPQEWIGMPVYADQDRRPPESILECGQ